MYRKQISKEEMSGGRIYMSKNEETKQRKREVQKTRKKKERN